MSETLSLLQFVAVLAGAFGGGYAAILGLRYRLRELTVRLDEVSKRLAVVDDHEKRLSKLEWQRNSHASER